MHSCITWDFSTSYIKLNTIDLLFFIVNIFVYETGYENYFTENLLDANNS